MLGLFFLPFLLSSVLSSGQESVLQAPLAPKTGRMMDFGGLWADSLCLYSSVTCPACCLSAAIWGRHFQAFWCLLLLCCPSSTEICWSGFCLMLFLPLKDLSPSPCMRKVCLWLTKQFFGLSFSIRRDGFETSKQMKCHLSLLQNEVPLSPHPSLKLLGSKTQAHLFLRSRDRK